MRGRDQSISKDRNFQMGPPSFLHGMLINCTLIFPFVIMSLGTPILFSHLSFESTHGPARRKH